MTKEDRVQVALGLKVHCRECGDTRSTFRWGSSSCMCPLCINCCEGSIHRDKCDECKIRWDK